MNIDPNSLGIITTNGTISGFLSHRTYWGNRSLARIVDQLTEETGELSQALMRQRYPVRRGGTKVLDPPDLIHDVVGEIADVLLCLDFLTKELGIERKQIDTLVTERATQLAIFLDTDQVGQEKL